MRVPRYNGRMDPLMLMGGPVIEPESEKALPVTGDEFSALTVMEMLANHKVLAVALSGGPDSMALLALVHEWALGKNIKIHAVTVDHALRIESAQEAQRVGETVGKFFPDVTHKVLRRNPDDIRPTRLQEDARHDRYDLMTDYCHAHGITGLLLAHHEDDQVETFFFRLCKGSGLDGLAAMRSVSALESGALTLYRPFLSIPKARLMATCQIRNLPYVNDPSNRHDRFARVRLRMLLKNLQGGLKAEGLSVSRLGTTTARLGQAVEALNHYAEKEWQNCLIDSDVNGLSFDWQKFSTCPQDIRMRLFMRALKKVGDGRGYGPRRERLEEIDKNLVSSEAFTRMTFHHCVIERSVPQNRLTFRMEKV